MDALVNSYIRIPEDEQSIENFGETPYYIMARKEDQELIDQLDYAIDCMNVETPNWRTELYNQYYGSEETNSELTEDEQALLEELQANNTVIRAVMNPDANPYSWYEDGEAHGIAADIFRATAKELNLQCEIVPVETKEEYEDESEQKYKLTEPYLSSTVSVLRTRGASEKIEKLVTRNDDIVVREILSSVWPNAEVTYVDTLEECKKKVLNGEADAALLMSYTAQKLAREDMQNRLRVEIVPGATIELKMGVNANDNCHFYGLWEKTLTSVSGNMSAEIV